MLISMCVMSGSFMPKSLKIFWNWGTIFNMMKTRMPTAKSDDEDRVDHGAADLALERLGAFLELGEPLEDDFQGAARLARLDHVDVQAVEGLGRLGHGLGERGAAFDFLADVDERVLQRAGLGLVLEDFQAAEDRQAGLLEDGQLAGEGGERLGVDAAQDEGLALLGAGLFLGRALAGLLDGDLGDEQALLLDRGLGFFLVCGLDRVPDFLSGLVHRLELKSWHGSIHFMFNSISISFQCSVFCWTPRI